MSGGMKKCHEAAFKAKVSLEPIKEEYHAAQLASDDDVHANQIGQGRRQLFKQLPAVVSERRKAGEQAHEEKEAELYRQIGQLKVRGGGVEKRSHPLRGARDDRGSSPDTTLSACDLTAIMPAGRDRHRRDVLSWEISPSRETRFCLTELERALSIATPEIFTSNQGSPVTSAEFAGRLTEARCTDQPRWWRPGL